MCCARCALVPILRLIALAVLAVGLAACLVGLVSPFWALYDPGLPRSAPAAALPPAADTTGDQAAPADADDDGIVYPSTPPTAVPSTREPIRRAESEGLWGRCDATNYTLCVWFWDDNFHLEKIFPVWHKAAQLLFLVGFITLVLAFLIASFNVCCGLCRHSVCLPTIISAIVLLAVLAIVASITVYGALAYKERGIRLGIRDPATVNDSNAAAAGDPGDESGAGDIVTVIRPGQAAHLDWAYYVAIAGAVAALLSAAIFFCDGRRSMSLAADGRTSGKREGYEAAASMEVI